MHKPLTVTEKKRLAELVAANTPLYALVLTEQSCPNPAPNNSWEFHGTSNGNGYAGGSHWANTGTWVPSLAGADLFFATWIA